MKACVIPGCDRPEVARGWCMNHYTAWDDHGDPLHPKAWRPWTPAEIARLEPILARPDGRAVAGELEELSIILERSRAAVCTKLSVLRRRRQAHAA